MKSCIQCKTVKSIEEFYQHKKMLDGRLNKCKSCCVEYAKERRINFPEISKAIDKRKSHTQQRKKWVLEYQKKTRSLNKQKYFARTKVSNSIRCGKLIKGPCVKCGSNNAQAHHPDYSQPLNVIWLCIKHHFEHHNNIANKTTILYHDNIS